MMLLRKLLATISLLLPAFLIALTWSLWQDRLPSELPTHWGLSGPADAVTHGRTLWSWLFGVSFGAGIVGAFFIWPNFVGKWTTRGIGAVAGFVVGETLAIWLVSSATALDVTDPYTVHLGAWGILLYVAPLYGLVPLVLLPFGDTPPVAGFSSVEASEQARVGDPLPKNYEVKITSKLFIILTAVMAIVTLLIFVLPLALAKQQAMDAEGVITFSFTMGIMLLAVVAVALFCAFTVTIDEHRFTVRSWLFNIPIKRIAHQDIEAVADGFLRPGEWGGWGYRIMVGRSAIILRAGTGLVITLKNKKQFAITLDDPATPARVLHGFMQQNNRAKTV